MVTYSFFEEEALDRHLIGRWKPALRAGHHAIDADTHRLDFERFRRHTFKGGAIIVVIEQPHSTDATLQQDHLARANTRRSWHPSTLPQ
jgi:hypothetical protein